MPPIKQPKRLKDLSLDVVSRTVQESCVRIETVWGDYDEPKTREKVQKLRDFLSENVYASLVEQLYEHLNVTSEQGERDDRPPAMRDVRIFFSLFFNERMKNITTRHVYLTKNPRRSIPRAVNDEFWLKNLPKLGNVTMLDLSFVCTDELLEVVCDNCLKLEEIDITSKMRFVNDGSEFGWSENHPKVFTHVSDQGLLFLSKCKKLKKIKMLERLNKKFMGKTMTLYGIRNLVKSLPHLESLTFDDMGSVLGSGMEDFEGRLSLTQITCRSPSLSELKEIVRLCPKLMGIVIVNDRGEGQASSAEIFSFLSNSDLQLKKLALENFPWDESLRSYLTSRGNHLSNFGLFGNCGRMTSKDITIIGELCPNLLQLNLFGLWRENIDPFEPKRKKPNELFKKLRHVFLGGQEWNPKAVFSACIANAENLTQIGLQNGQNDNYFDLVSSVCLDQAFPDLKISNKLEKLEKLMLYGRLQISDEVFRSFVEHCPVLSAVEVSVKNFRREFVEEWKSKNYDIVFNVI